MNANDYCRDILVPNVMEFFADRGERRRAYNACQSAFHLCDFLSEQLGVSLREVRSEVRRRHRFAFEVIEGLALGSKHYKATRQNVSFKYEAGTAQHREAFTIDHSFLDVDRIETAGLLVQHDGRDAFVDECLKDCLSAARLAYVSELPAIDSILAAGPAPTA